MLKPRYWFLSLGLVIILISSNFGGIVNEPVHGKEKVKITIAAGAVGQELEIAKEGAERYMDKHPNVKIELFNAPNLNDNRFSLYKQHLWAKDPKIDIYQIDVIWPGDLAEHFVDLREYVPAKAIDQHFSTIIENNTVNDKLVAMPWYADIALLYYRKDLLNKYGFNPPTTWRQLEKITRTIKQKEHNRGNSDLAGFLWQGNVYEGLTCTALEWIASQGGGQIIKPDGKVTINNPQAVKAINRAASWVGDISPKSVLNMTEEKARKKFQAGEAIFMRNWPYAYPLLQKDHSPVQGKVGVTSLPSSLKGESVSTLGGWQLGVSKYSQHIETAVDVVLFLTSYEEQKRRAIKGGFNPTIKELYQDKEVVDSLPLPFYNNLYEVFVNAVPRPSTVTAPHYKKVSRAFYTEVYNVLTGRKKAEDIVNYLEDKYVNMGLQAPQDTKETKQADQTNYTYYTIQDGDTLYKISKKFNTTIQKILSLNDRIDDPNVIISGRKLKIPE